GDGAASVLDGAAGMLDGAVGVLDGAADAMRGGNAKADEPHAGQDITVDCATAQEFTRMVEQNDGDLVIVSKSFVKTVSVPDLDPATAVVTATRCGLTRVGDTTDPLACPNGFTCTDNWPSWMHSVECSHNGFATVE